MMRFTKSGLPKSAWTLFALLFWAGTVPAAAKLRVVVSVPCLADMAAEIGKDQIDVLTLATGREDLHAVPARPSFLPRLNRADLLFSLGLDAEHAWLPALAAEARNPKIMEGGENWVEVYHGIEILDIPKKLDRSEGEQHPEGNPHFNIGPQCGKIMATNIAHALIHSDPSHADFFNANLEGYKKKLADMEKRLKEKGAALRGVAVVSHHSDISYIAAFYGLKYLGSLEPKPGIPPTVAYLAGLSSRARSAEVKLILYNQSQDNRIPEKIAGDIGATAVRFAGMVGAKKGIRTWIELQEYNLEIMLAGLAKK